MSVDRRATRLDLPSLPFLLLLALLFILWGAGGASRADALGQTVVRAASLLLLAAAALLWRPPHLGGAKPVFFILLAAVALPLIQLAPLPPSLWQSLPGRAMLTEAVSGQQPWRPLAIAPSATFNAAASLVVPLAVFLLAIGIRAEERHRLPMLMLGLIIATMLLGLVQFSGSHFNNPLISNDARAFSGSFANRNHFALFLALGCLIAPVWAFADAHRALWRGPAALGLAILLLLVILVSGSRSGLVLGLIALAFGPLIALRQIRATMRRYPRWAAPALIVGVLIAIAALVAISIGTNRAVSIHRAFNNDLEQDMRVRAFPTVVEVARTNLPLGSGFGSFDTVFRMHEPESLLKPTYFNHAHNDFLEIVLDGGLLALILLAAALLWWLAATIRVWRAAPSSRSVLLGRLGSAMLLLVLFASATDYPARTPLIMGTITIAALWLGWGAKAAQGNPLPGQEHHL